MTLKFFFSPGACSLATHIALEEAGVPFEAIRLNFAAGEQTKPDYLAINPKGRVPALVTGRGTLTENIAILAWLAQTNSAKNLAPTEPFEFARMQAFNSYLASTVHVNHSHKGRGYRWATLESSFEDMRRKVPESMAAAFDLIERELLVGPWAMGEQYTVSDPYLYTMTRWLIGDGVEVSRFPRVADHMARMEQRPAVKAALAREAAA